MIRFLILFALLNSFLFPLDEIYGGINISYDGNNSKINNLSIFLKNKLKNNNIISKYNLEFDLSNKDKIQIKQANISFKNYLGEIIIGNMISPNYIQIYKAINDFEYMKDFKNDTYIMIDNIFKQHRFSKNQITYTFPSVYNSVSEIDYIFEKEKLNLRNTWIKNNLQTSIYYHKEKDESIERWAMSFYYQNKTSITSYIYENNTNSWNTHSFSIKYLVKNYHFKSLYVFNNLDKDIFINGVDIFLLKEKNKIAKIYFENISSDKLNDGYVFGALFVF